MCKVSVILPTYNVEQHIKKCIESILAQTFQDFEIIVVNDESTDNSVAAVTSFQDKRIRIINKKNGGAAQARKTGVENAVGEYIAFIDPDDWIEPNMLEELYNTVMAYDADIVSCEFFQETSEGKLMKTSCALKSSEYNSENAIKAIHNMSAIYEFMWNKLFRKQILLLDVFPTDFFTCEDYCVITSTIARQSLKIYHLNKPLYHYVFHGSNMTRAGFGKTFILSHLMWNRKMQELIEIFPKQKRSIIHYNVLQKMAIINAMFRNNTYDKEIMKECIHFIRKYSLSFCCSPWMCLLHKGSAVIMSLNLKLYKKIYLRLLS